FLSTTPEITVLQKMKRRLRHPQQRGEVNIFPSHTGNYGAPQNEIAIAASATERGSKYFLSTTPEITVLQKMKRRLRHPQQRGEVNIFPSHTGNYGAPRNEMTIAASATERGSRYFLSTHRKLGASQNETTIATSTTERESRYFSHHTPQITVLHKMK
ncbi:MAG: hypothetical protein SWX82_02345, partial [Cyanobacteriota bacterium]|nr:hypothetical protein [Cyanobacteriota bacterium]